MNELQTIISRRPGWIIRWGNLFFLLILVSFFYITWLISYPDVVRGTLTIHRLSGNNFYGRLEVPATAMQELKKGQPVIVKVAGYPVARYGYIAGTIDLVPDATARPVRTAITISLPPGLKTNYGQQIAYTEGLKADAEILTGRRKLFDRFLQQLSPKPISPSPVPTSRQ